MFIPFLATYFLEVTAVVSPFAILEVKIASNINIFKAISLKQKRKSVTEVIYLSFILLKFCGALRDLVPFVQFKKHEKHPWRSVTFSKVAGCFFHFLNCTNGIAQSTTFIPFLTISYGAVIARVSLNISTTLQTHHVYSTLKRRGNGVSTWNTRGVFIGQWFCYR